MVPFLLEVGDWRLPFLLLELFRWCCGCCYRSGWPRAGDKRTERYPSSPIKKQ